VDDACAERGHPRRGPQHWHGGHLVCGKRRRIEVLAILAANQTAAISWLPGNVVTLTGKLS
jgi:hypothetical protein